MFSVSVLLMDTSMSFMASTDLTADFVQEHPHTVTSSITRDLGVILPTKQLDRFNLEVFNFAVRSP